MTDEPPVSANGLLAEGVKEALALLGWTESRVARWAGISQPAINQFLAGKKGLSDAAKEKLAPALIAALNSQKEALEAQAAARKKGADNLSSFANLLFLKNYGTTAPTPALTAPTPTRKAARIVLVRALAYLAKHEKDLVPEVADLATARLHQQYEAMLELQLAGQDSPEEVLRVLGLYVARLEVILAQYERRIADLEAQGSGEA